MRAIGWLLKRFNPHFMTEYWTTWFGCVYAPNWFDLDDLNHHVVAKEVLLHENVHRKDWEKHLILFPVTYVFPPMFIALGRVHWECRAQIPSFRNIIPFSNEFESRIISVADSLGSSEYLWTAPKFIIRWWLRTLVLHEVSKNRK